jgi:hypothetical protein
MSPPCSTPRPMTRMPQCRADEQQRLEDGGQCRVASDHLANGAIPAGPEQARQPQAEAAQQAARAVLNVAEKEHDAYSKALERCCCAI